ncbi:MAG: hypothetical protein KJ847_03975 [Firmicutes bacterium]|nr:hypothetical protein [Bacillota bacterium]
MQKKTSKLKFKNKTKANILKNWLSSLFMTVTAVVVIVLVIPKSAEAKINHVQAFEHEVVYSLDVEDQDSSIISGTLKVVLENQFEYYEYPLVIGSNSGVFTELKENTLYHFTIKADKGFGLETLAKEDIKTKEGLQGVIFDVTSADVINDYELSYLVRTFYNDSQLELKEIYIKFGYVYPGESEVLQYQIIPISGFDQFTLIEGIPNYNCNVYLTLEGINQSDEIIILDEYQFRTPVYINSSFYLKQVSDNLIGVDAYADFQVVEGIEYEVVLSKNNQILRRKELIPNLDMMHYEMSSIVFDNLKPNTVYNVDLYATYLDPESSKIITVSLGSIETTTLSDYQADVVVTEFPTYYEVTITVTDPDHNFQKGVYWLYEVTSDYEYLMQNIVYDFTRIGEDKTTSFMIYKQNYLQYRIEIGIQSETELIYYVVLKTIEINE